MDRSEESRQYDNSHPSSLIQSSDESTANEHRYIPTQPNYRRRNAQQHQNNTYDGDFNDEQMMRLISQLSTEDALSLQNELKQCAKNKRWTVTVPCTGALTGMAYVIQRRLTGSRTFTGFPVAIGCFSFILTDMAVKFNCNNEMKPFVRQLASKYALQASSTQPSPSIQSIREQHTVASNDYGILSTSTQPSIPPLQEEYRPRSRTIPRRSMYSDEHETSLMSGTPIANDKNSDPNFMDRSPYPPRLRRHGSKTNQYGDEGFE